MRYRDGVLLSHIEAIFSRSESFALSKESNDIPDEHKRRAAVVRAALQDEIRVRFAEQGTGPVVDSHISTIPIEFVSAEFVVRSRRSALKLEWRLHDGTLLSFYIRRSDIAPIHHPNMGLKDAVELQIASDLSTLVDEYIVRYTVRELDESVLRMDGRLES